jgi:hypothetical protein
MNGYAGDMDGNGMLKLYIAFGNERNLMKLLAGR